MRNLDISYCGKIVKDNDPDRFLLSMLMSAECREGLWALFAFNYEISKTREVVSEMQLGFLRLQWWREEIGKIYEGSGALKHEILTPLAIAIRLYDLPREHFDALLYAREFDLDDVLPSNLEGLMNYADFTSTPLIKLAVQIIGDDPEIEPVQVIAIGYALSGILRSVPFHARQRRCLLPEDLLKEAGIGLSNHLYEFKSVDRLSEVVKIIFGEIIIDARPQSKFLNGLQGLTRIYAGRIRRVKYDVFHPRMTIEPPFKVLRVLCSVM
ncbi:MAG: squalene/phytoene synthase family protein [Alphaproteobacteria bacterium]|nr:squalene/phytoene synthase family protein [Alphaproteobacteria bacterium]